MAAPMVSAEAAVLIEKEPGISPDTVKARLMRSARKTQDEPYARGARVLDISAALAEDGCASFAPSPRIFRDPFEPILTVEDLSALWGDTALWSDTARWGDSIPGSD